MFRSTVEYSSESSSCQNGADKAMSHRNPVWEHSLVLKISLAILLVHVQGKFIAKTTAFKKGMLAPVPLQDSLLEDRIMVLLLPWVEAYRYVLPVN